MNIHFRICYRCGGDKPLSEYYRDESKPGGRQASCKDCQSIYYLGRENRWRNGMLNIWGRA